MMANKRSKCPKKKKKKKKKRKAQSVLMNAPIITNGTHMQQARSVSSIVQEEKALEVSHRSMRKTIVLSA